MSENRVVFGVSNLHVGTYSVDSNGAVTLGTPLAVPGTVNISLDPETEENKFYADDIVYWSGYTDNGYSGEIENANFSDEFKLAFLNYITLDDGAIAQIKGMESKKVYMAFQSDGDAEARRGILYNVALGAITREYKTKEDTTEPATSTLPITVNGDNATGIIKAVYAPSNARYATLFTNPPTPALPTASGE